MTRKVTHAQHNQQRSQEELCLQSLFDDETSAPAFPPAPTMMPTAFSIAVPSKTANAAAPAATGTTKPDLLGLLQTLPHSVTTFSVSSAHSWASTEAA